MRGLTYDELAEAYVMRHGFDTPMPWKVIARKFGTTSNAMQQAIRRLERNGLNRDACGEKPLSRVTHISNAQLLVADLARTHGYSWPMIAFAMNVPVDTLKSRYRRAHRSH